MTTSLVALGSNLGNSVQTLHHAVERLRQIPASQVVGVATFRITKPVGCVPGTPEFVNSAVKMQTSLGARDLLANLLAIENEFGRQRPPAEDRSLPGPRTLDLDLLLHGNEVISTPDLHLPHPRMHERLFVLEPAAEIAPEMPHPLLGKSLAALLSGLRARLEVQR